MTFEKNNKWSTDKVLQQTIEPETGISYRICISGCFRLPFDYEHWFLKTNCWFTRFDVNEVRFGDQSLFITKKVEKHIPNNLKINIEGDQVLQPWIPRTR